jgi:hypothetical protein
MPVRKGMKPAWGCEKLPNPSFRPPQHTKRARPIHTRSLMRNVFFKINLKEIGISQPAYPKSYFFCNPSFCTSLPICSECRRKNFS